MAPHRHLDTYIPIEKKVYRYCSIGIYLLCEMYIGFAREVYASLSITFITFAKLIGTNAFAPLGGTEERWQSGRSRRS